MAEPGSGVRDGKNVQVPINGKARRRRTVYTQCHLELLRKTFETNPYPSFKVREKLSQRIGINESRIHVWFQNYRARENKKKFPKEDNAPRQEQTLLQLNPAAPQASSGEINPEHLGQPGVAPTNLQFSSHPMMNNPAEHQLCSDNTVKPVHVQSSENVSLQDLLEEFQPEWIELADKCIASSDDLRSLLL